jgi:polysaccharide biosynthesis protein PelF
LNRHSGFNSFFLGGFECSSHIRRCGTRLDLINATAHDKFAALDYKRLKTLGINTARDGIRWHLIENRPYNYDWSNVLPMVHAARDTGVQVIWDLCHYGWPDDLDIFRPEFVRRFSHFARSFASLVFNETDDTPYFAPMNEVSFISWGAGDQAIIHPFQTGRALELKCQLVRATLAATDAIRDVVPHARFIQVDPLINVVTEPGASEQQKHAAASYTRAQFEAFEMLAGRLWPQLGGNPNYLDIIGANYYVHNQWVIGGKFIERDDPRYRPLHHLLGDLYRLTGKPLFLAETGIEDDRRPEWLRYIVDEVIIALEAGIPVEGICLYPIVNHPGWEDDRHCHNGLWDYCNESGHREIYKPLAHELSIQSARVQAVLRKLGAGRHMAHLRPVLRAEEASAGVS